MLLRRHGRDAQGRITRDRQCGECAVPLSTLEPEDGAHDKIKQDAARKPETSWYYTPPRAALSISSRRHAPQESDSGAAGVTNGFGHTVIGREESNDSACCENMAYIRVRVPVSLVGKIA